MALCPVCQQTFRGDTSALENHVNTHFDDHAGSSNAQMTRPAPGPRSRTKPLEATECPVCGFPFLDTPLDQIEDHINDCLDGPRPENRRGSSTEQLGQRAGDSMSAAQKNNDNYVAEEWDGPARPGGWADWVSKKPAMGDQWWDPTSSATDTSIPSNFSPAALSALKQVLRESTRSYTLKARLSADLTHIRYSWRLDTGWGCGYRNALMCISSLLLYSNAYQQVFSREKQGSEPGVRRIQGWIEEAWSAGFDREGAVQLGEKLLGTRKWIGPTDLYAMFSYLGIPCELYDFPRANAKPQDKSARRANQALVEWVKRYFDEDVSLPAYSSAQPANVFDVLMRSGHADAGSNTVIQTAKLPLILQHKGHSRTIVGYEEAHRGTNLLLFDPGRTVPTDLRSAGIDTVRKNQAKAPTPPRKPSHESSHESLRFSRPYTNGNSEPVFLPPQDSPEVLDDEEMSADGWVKKKVNRLKKSLSEESGVAGGKDARHSPSQILSEFRVSVEKLGKFDQYQVLLFTGGPVLTPEARAQRRVLTSTPVRP